MNGLKKSCIMSLCFVIFMFIGVLKVGATTVTIDPNNNIEMSEYLFSDKASTFEINSLSTYQTYYQIKDVTNNTTLVGYIDSLITQKATYNQLAEKYNTTTDETVKAQLTTSMNDANTAIATTKTNMQTAVDDYTESEWIETTDKSIPYSSITAKNYYVVWVKVKSGENSYYEYEAYQAINSSDVKATTNPDTGIETTFLYIGVALSIGFGSYLVINKNKERYE